MELLGLCIIVAVVGGGIAYVGDWMGSYIGRRRKMIFGWRPRVTATRLTIAAGALIAVVTYGGLLAYDSAVRLALEHGQEIIKENKHLTWLNHHQEVEIKFGDMQARLAEAAAASAVLQADQARVQLADSLRQLTSAQATLGQSKAELMTRQQQLASAEQEYARARDSLGTTRRELADSRDNLTEARYNVTHADAECVKAERNIIVLLETQDLLTHHNKVLSANNAKLENSNASLAVQVTASEGNNIVYRVGQEVGRAVIDTNSDPSVVRGELVVFLDRLSGEAEVRGANVGKNRRAVVVVSPLADGPDITPTSTLDPADEDLNLDALAHNISDKADTLKSVVVVAHAKYNSFKDEQTRITLSPYDNKLIFKRDAEIASVTLDGSQPENIILSSLQSFLLDSVRPAAIKQGIIPTHDPQTGEASVGVPIDSDTWVKLVKRIEQIGSGATITARAQEDTYSSGPLRLILVATQGPDVAATNAAPASPQQ